MKLKNLKLKNETAIFLMRELDCNLFANRKKRIQIAIYTETELTDQFELGEQNCKNNLHKLKRNVL